MWLTLLTSFSVRGRTRGLGMTLQGFFCKVAGAGWGPAALPRSPLVLWGIANTWLVLMLVLKMLVFKEKIVDPLGSTENDGYSVQAERVGRLWAGDCPRFQMKWSRWSPRGPWGGESPLLSTVCSS